MKYRRITTILYNKLINRYQISHAYTIYFNQMITAKINKLIHSNLIDFRNVKDIINKLNKYSIYRQPKYILLFDYIYSPVCEDLNAFTIFQYYKSENIENAFYVLNEETELYKSLLRQNRTMNVIPYKSNQNNSHLFEFMLNSKIIIQSYALFEFQTIASKVKYLKFLYICHAVNYFKTSIIKIQLSRLDKRKQNIILTSPYEYNLYKKLNLYDDMSMHKAGLARYDRLNYIKKNTSEKDCILVSFTYRSFKEPIYNKSLFKKNIINLFRDKSLNSFLKAKNTDFIFIQHHNDVKRGRKININDFPQIKFKEQKYLSYYIEQCSLLITDFSSISFDFMFQNKPVLFYFLDVKDKIKFKEKSFMKIDKENNIYFNNVFTKQGDLVNKIINYINKNYTLDYGLQEKYKTLFYYNQNITQKIVKIINNITKIN